MFRALSIYHPVDSVSFDGIILGILIFSLLITVSLLGFVAFTSPRQRRTNKH
ncbi:TPA_asm: hypothetical protein [ssRNA phage Gerhypos.2_17]|uniref:Uncharacterized protein n=2 Tax=Leviviricetes TaxID=2842243 RepID=A0A8S5L124_9VIRU|nr:hypothetical protein QIO16_gp3 [ssRNA phage Gerhypos.2_17]QDH88396.1 MAG: hypothetical protein H2Bulk35234_000002 [Leviviridae sp.]DAD51598.1 TPA_asm: hypothetical protein [ssRNA phage Gerhypos.2_17]